MIACASVGRSPCWLPAELGARHGQHEPDYVLLVQERSARVLNLTGRLAVVPKPSMRQRLRPPRRRPLSALAGARA